MGEYGVCIQVNNLIADTSHIQISNPSVSGKHRIYNTFIYIYSTINYSMKQKHGMQ